MKKIYLLLVILFLGSSLTAQEKVHILKNGEHVMARSIDSTQIEETIVLDGVTLEEFEALKESGKDTLAINRGCSGSSISSTSLLVKDWFMQEIEVKETEFIIRDGNIVKKETITETITNDHKFWTIVTYICLFIMAILVSLPLFGLLKKMGFYSLLPFLGSVVTAIFSLLIWDAEGMIWGFYIGHIMGSIVGVVVFDMNSDEEGFYIFINGIFVVLLLLISVLFSGSFVVFFTVLLVFSVISIVAINPHVCWECYD